MAASPLPSSLSHERDSIVIPKRSTPKSWLAGTCDGRYVFRVDNMRITSVGIDRFLNWNLDEDECLTFTIDVVDLFTAREHSFKEVGDLFEFGAVCEVFAPDKNSLIIIEYHFLYDRLRQHVIRFDWKNMAASCDFYRSYHVDLGIQKRHVAIGTNITVVQTDVRRAYTFPTNPFSPDAHRCISPLVNQASAYVNVHYAPMRAVRPRGTGAICHKPFIISDTAIGYFVGIDRCFDLMNVVVVDMSTNSMYMQEVALPPGSCRLDWERRTFIPIDSNSLHQAMDKEASMLSYNKDFCAILDTRLLRWTELKVGKELRGYSLLMCIRDGMHFLIHDIVSEIGDSRPICEEVKGCEEMERIRLIRHPLRVPSLLRLSSIAVQKSGGVQQLSDLLI